MAPEGQVVGSGVKLSSSHALRNVDYHLAITGGDHQKNKDRQFFCRSDRQKN
ncbi:hypothetical protein [Streptomyces sp. DB-54]